MSVMNYMILTLCILSTVSAIPSLSIVFRAEIRNGHSAPMQCDVHWATFDNAAYQKETVTIESQGRVVTAEKTVDMGTWTASAFIQKIQCNGFTLAEPFPKVNSIQGCWQFLVEPNKINSVGPGSCA